ncbi:MAG TPA: hypothetical protein VEC57_07050 [Candidatus Limnocylindrales bacterium]|nr:hypothetical protein [Candidatus Limnocylindrales bacterium]
MLGRPTLLCALIVALACGCGPSLKKAIVRDFEPRQVEEIVVLPAIDARIDRSGEPDFDRQMREITLSLLRLKGYGATSDFDHPRLHVVEEELRDPTPQFIAGLGPPDARWVMVVTLVELLPWIPFVRPAQAEVHGYMFDKKAGRLVWKDKGFADHSQGGRVVVASDDVHPALTPALVHLIASIPHHWGEKGGR